MSKDKHAIFWDTVKEIKNRRNQTNKDKNYRKKELEQALEKLGCDPLDKQGKVIPRPVLTSGTTQTQIDKNKKALNKFYKNIFQVSKDKEETEIASTSSTAEIKKTGIEGLSQFIQDNRNFKFTKANKQKIDALNAVINNFYEHPEQYITDSKNKVFEDLKYEIAKVRAQIKAYRDFLEMQDANKQIEGINKKISVLEEKKSRVTSKEDENYYLGEIETCQRLKILTECRKDLTPSEFLTLPQWAFERAHLKLAQEEKAIEYLMAKIKKTINGDDQKQIAFYEGLIQYFNTEKSQGRWPTYDGYIASQAPVIRLSSTDIANYREAQLKIISESKKQLFQSIDFKTDSMFKSLEESIKNYQCKHTMDVLQKENDYKTFMKIIENASYFKKSEVHKSEYQLFLELKTYSKSLTDAQKPSVEGFFTSQFFKDQSRHQSFRSMLQNIPKGADEEQALITKFKSLSEKYERLILVEKKDENSISTIQQKLEEQLKSREYKTQKKIIKEQITFFKAFSQYIEDEKKLRKQASYDGFLISQAPTLSMTKEKMDTYRNDQINKITELESYFNDDSKEKELLTKMQRAYEGFPQAILGPQNPSHYDPQIAPVYQKYLASFVEDSSILEDLKFAADDHSHVIHGLTTTEKFDISYPNEEKADAIEKQSILLRLQAITEKKEINEQKDWVRDNKQKIHEHSQKIVESNGKIKENEEKLQKLESLWKQFQVPGCEQKIEEELKSLELNNLNEQGFEELKKNRQIDISNDKLELKKTQEERTRLQAKLNEAERLIGMDFKNSLLSETLYSSATNPIQSVQYDFEGESLSITNKVQDTSPVCFPAPVASDYATVTYKNGAKLRLGKDGKIYLPNIPEKYSTLSEDEKDKENEQLRYNEEEFVTQLLEKFEKNNNPLKTIKIRGIHDYTHAKNADENIKARMLKKMVMRYCYNSNGQWDNKKFMDLKFALTQGLTVTDDDIEKNPKFSFLKSRSLFQRYVRDDFRRDTSFQRIISEKRKDELLKEEIKSLSLHSPAYYAIKERNVSLQQQASIRGFFRRSWNALRSSGDDEKKAKECLQTLVDVCKEDWEHVFSPQVCTPEQNKIQKAKDFLKKYLGLEDKDLKSEIEKIRKDPSPGAKL